MNIVFQCTQCGGKHQVAEGMAGKQARCRCGAVLTIPARQTPMPSTPSMDYAPQQAPRYISIQCPGCGRQHQANASMASQSARCGCGTVLQITHPHNPSCPAQQNFAPQMGFAQQPYQPQQYQQQPFQQQQYYPQQQDPFSDDWSAAEVSSQPTFQSFNPNQFQQTAPVPATRSNDRSLESNIMNSGMLSGIAAMAVAVIWFVGGLAVGFIFFYPPVLFVIGLVGFISGVIKRKA